MSEAADQAADTATGEAVKAHLTGGTEKSAPLFDKAAVAHRRAEQSATLSDGWRDGTEVAPLAPMPEAPTMHEQEASNAIQKLQTIDGGNELVESWGSDFKSNLSYARAAFQEIATPELIAKFDASGLGNDPAILEHLAKHGRLNAGFTGIDPVAQYQPSFTNREPSRMSNSSNSSAQAELDQILEKNAPGTPGYAKLSVQSRVQALHRAISGDGPAVGRGGRRA